MRKKFYLGDASVRSVGPEQCNTMPLYYYIFIYDSDRYSWLDFIFLSK